MTANQVLVQEQNKKKKKRRTWSGFVDLVDHFYWNGPYMEKISASMYQNTY